MIPSSEELKEMKILHRIEKNSGFSQAEAGIPYRLIPYGLFNGQWLCCKLTLQIIRWQRFSHSLIAFQYPKDILILNRIS